MGYGKKRTNKSKGPRLHFMKIVWKTPPRIRSHLFPIKEIRSGKNGVVMNENA